LAGASGEAPGGGWIASADGVKLFPPKSLTEIRKGDFVLSHLSRKERGEDGAPMVGALVQPVFGVLRLEAVGQIGGELDGDQRTAAGITDNFKMSLVAVEDFEALLHILHADTGAGAA
jgi:hypothetical protein